MVDCGTTCVVKLVNVPSISKNAALMSIAVMENTFRICNFVIARLFQCRGADVIADTPVHATIVHDSMHSGGLMKMLESLRLNARYNELR